MRNKGHIISWKREKEFGFIRADGVPRDVFLHANDIKQKGYVPVPGDEVFFLLTEGAGGKAKALQAKFPAARPALMARTAFLISLVLLQLSLLAGVLVGSFFLYPATFLPLLVYLAMSAVTFLAYYFDKRQAIKRGRRLSERAMHTFELFGGWPGAIFAQGILRHKSSKPNYRRVLWGIIVLHFVGLAYLVVSGASLSELLGALLQWLGLQGG